MSDGFRYYLRVRYCECDAQKVVFNARYGDYVDVMFGEFLRAMGFGEAMASGNIDFQLVRQTFEWSAPARYDQVLEMAPSVKRLGNTSFTIFTKFRIAGQCRVIATAETIYVNVSPKDLMAEALPADFRAALEKGAQDMTVNHAGMPLPSMLEPVV